MLLKLIDRGTNRLIPPLRDLRSSLLFQPIEFLGQIQQKLWASNELQHYDFFGRRILSRILSILALVKGSSGPLASASSINRWSLLVLRAASISKVRCSLAT